MHIVPTMFVRLLRLPAAVKKKYDLSSLRWIIHAAAPCPPAVKRAMIELVGAGDHTSTTAPPRPASWSGTFGRGAEEARHGRPDGRGRDHAYPRRGAATCRTARSARSISRDRAIADFTYTTTTRNGARSTPRI